MKQIKMETTATRNKCKHKNFIKGEQIDTRLDEVRIVKICTDCGEEII